MNALRIGKATLHHVQAEGGHRGSPELMKLLIARIVIAGICVLLVVARYGSLEPCDMLRTEVQRQLLASIVDERAADRLAALGTVRGMATLRDMLEATTAGRSQGECLTALVRLHGDPDLSAMLGASGSAQANADATPSSGP